MGKRRESSCGGRHCWGSGKKGESSCGSGHYCGSGKIDSAPAGAVTAGAVGTYREESCWSRHYCGSGENREKVPARAGTTAVVKKQLGGGFLWWRGGCWEGEGGGWVGGRGSCWSKHCCGSEKIEGGRGGGGGGGRLLLEQALLRQVRK